jgi:TonB-dependent receptor
MKMFTALLVSISLLVILNNTVLMAQGGTSKIQGKIADVSTGEPLPGANVILVGTSFGGSSDLNGGYLITNVPPGTYSIQFSYIGYKSYKAEKVKVLPESTFVLDANLSPESITGETVVITAQKQGQTGAINQQIASSSIKDIVAKDWIQEVPDVNAAESIGRLPGVSLQRDGGEGNKIIVRGLSPKYNNVEIDGVQLQGVDLDRSAGLSAISDEMLEGIELSKTLTPDMDADALGGVANLTLKKADEGLHFNVLTQGSYNDLRKDANNYKLAGRISDRFFENSLGVIANLGTEKINRSDDVFGANYGTYLTNQVQQLTAQNAQVEQLLDERYRSFGDVVLDYETAFMKLKMDNLVSQQLDDNQDRQNSFLFTNNEFDFNIYRSKPIQTIRSHSLSGVFSFLNTELKLEGSYSNSRYTNYQDQYNFRDQDIIKLTPYGTIPPSAVNNAQPSDLITKYYLISTPKYADLWSNVMTTTNRKDETYSYNADWKIPYSITQDVSGNIRVGGRFSDKDRNSNVVEQQGPYYGGRGIQTVTTMEGDSLFRNLLYNYQVGINRSDGIPAANWVVPNYNWGNIFGGRYTLGYSENLGALDAFSRNVYNWDGAFLVTDGQQTYQNDYSNNEKKTAVYIMTEVRVGENMMLLPGVRYEKFHSAYNSYFIQEENEAPTGIQYIKPVTSYNDNEFWFPSVNAKYDVNDWSDVRAAYYKSCTRPDYQQLSPGITADPGKTSLIAYNPYLKPAIANNFDLMYSFHSNKAGLFSIDGFYKEIDGLIISLPQYQPQFFDMVQNAPPDLIAELQAPRSLYDPTLFTTKGQTMNNFPVNNPNKTFFRGFEINWETNFWYLPGLLSNVVLDVNYSKIWSTTWIPYLNIIKVLDTTKVIPVFVNTPFYATRQARMLDQPADIFNVRLGWDYKGFSTRISYRYQGATATNIDPQYSLLDAFSKAQSIVDWTMKQELYKNLSFLADIANLSNYIDDSYDQTGNSSYPKSSNSYGPVAQVGLRYEFN